MCSYTMDFNGKELGENEMVQLQLVRVPGCVCRICARHCRRAAAGILSWDAAVLFCVCSGTAEGPFSPDYCIHC